MGEEESLRDKAKREHILAWNAIISVLGIGSWFISLAPLEIWNILFEVMKVLKWVWKFIVENEFNGMSFSHPKRKSHAYNTLFGQFFFGQHVVDLRSHNIRHDLFARVGTQRLSSLRRCVRSTIYYVSIHRTIFNQSCVRLLMNNASH